MREWRRRRGKELWSPRRRGPITPNGYDAQDRAVSSFNFDSGGYGSRRSPGRQSLALRLFRHAIQAVLLVFHLAAQRVGRNKRSALRRQAAASDKSAGGTGVEAAQLSDCALGPNLLATRGCTALLMLF